MKFNRESFEKAIRVNHIVKYQVFFEDVVKSYLEIENQRVVKQSEKLNCNHKDIELITHAAKCKDCGIVFETKW